MNVDEVDRVIESIAGRELVKRAGGGAPVSVVEQLAAEQAGLPDPMNAAEALTALS